MPETTTTTEAGDNAAEHMDKLITEMEAHIERLRLLAATPELTVQQVMADLGTVLGLTKDFAALTLGEVVDLQADVDAIGPGGDPDDSVLFPDDADLLTTRLLAYREVLGNMLMVADESRKGQVQQEINETDTALARVAEITVDEPGDGEPEEPEPESDPEPEEQRGRRSGRR